MPSENTRMINVAGSDVVAVSGTSAQSIAFDTKEIQLVSTTNCWIKFGTDATAVANTDANQYLPANIIWTIKWNPGDEVAVIQDTAGGYLTVTPVGY
jgi:hypothetical protein